MLKLPITALGTLLASRVLPGDAKVLWEKHVYLDRDERGCRMSAGKMALLVGRSAESIEQFRRRFVRLGLLTRGGGASRAAAWFVAFPGECLPRSVRPSPAEYAAAGDVLDVHLRRLGGWNPDTELPNGHSGNDHYPLPNVHSAIGRVSSPASVRGEGGKGGGAPLSSGDVITPPLSSKIPEGGDVLLGHREGGDGFAEFRRAIADMRPRVTP